MDFPHSRNAPTDHFELFTGPIGYRTGNLELTPAPGRIDLFLRAGSHLDWAIKLDEAEANVRRQWEHFSTTGTSGELRSSQGRVSVLARRFHRAAVWVRVDHAKGAPNQERWFLLCELSEQGLEHLSGEEEYRVLSAGSVDTSGVAVVGQAGGVLLTETVRTAGLDILLSHSRGRWRKPLAVHDPGKVIIDLALSLVLGGGCLADVGVLRGEPGVFGRVASYPTVSRTIDTLARDASLVLAVIDGARAAARLRVWTMAGWAMYGHCAPNTRFLWRLRATRGGSAML